MMTLSVQKLLQFWQWFVIRTRRGAEAQFVFGTLTLYLSKFFEKSDVNNPKITVFTNFEKFYDILNI